MCTAATYKTKDLYFGRTLDYEFSYGETVTVTPRNFRLEFRHMGVTERHFAFIGMAHVADNYPLYYDAVNEKGLCIAGLNFVGNAHYRECREGKDNLAQWELIPWIMARCASVSEAKALLARINLTAEPFAPNLPTAQLHWIISDKAVRSRSKASATEFSSMIIPWACSRTIRRSRSSCLILITTWVCPSIIRKTASPSSLI